MAQNFIENIVKMSFLEVTYEVNQKEGNLDISFEGDDGHIMTDNGFELVTSIEQLLRKHLIKKAAFKNSFKINISVNGEMNSREAKLESLAKRMKARALKTKKPITLNSMNPRDRRIVHQFLHDDDQVTTKSFGDGHYKRIKIFPVLPKKNEELPSEED